MLHSSSLVLVTIFSLSGVSRAGYTIQDNYNPSNWFQEFEFFTGSDPTNGFVQYASAAVANQTSLAGYAESGIFLGVDSTTMNPAQGRPSVRMTSSKSYNHGLFIADIAHAPTGCGTWPAMWLFDSSATWPQGGEIDIMEGVNSQTSNQMTLHTAPGCSFEQGDCNAGGGTTGCFTKSQDPQTFGSGFNAIGGGVYALDWTSEALSIYFFPRSAIPSDIQSGNPNPASWGSPAAKFSGSGCDIDEYFTNQNLVFNIDVCGAWAGAQSVWSADQTCSKLASTCQEYAASNPSAFIDAYWLINSVKVYSQAGTAKRGTIPKHFRA